MYSNVAIGTHPKTYVAWINMRQRCNNVDSPDYHNYGGRGITVCKEWSVYSNFLADMGESPKYWSLDRIDNNKGYSKDNCRWASHTAQMNNRRDRSTETNLRTSNMSGISGVYWTGAKGTWQVKAPNKDTRTFYNLLDACCYRLSPHR